MTAQRMKQSLTGAVAILILACVLLTAGSVVRASGPASDETPPPLPQCDRLTHPSCSDVDSSGVSSFQAPNINGDGAGSLALSVASGSGWSVEYKLRSFRIGTSKIKYGFAYTDRLSGTGPHELEVHGALVRDVGAGGDYETVYSFDPVVDDDGYVIGGQTDSYHNAGNDLWLVASGHYYDHGDNGHIDASCDGCIDQHFQGS